MTLRHLQFFTSLLIVIGATCISMPAFSAPAPPSGRCDEIELVFVVDQSGSMPGSPEHETPNDPLGLRFFGPLGVARWMGEDYVVAQGVPVAGRPPITYHIALVDFGTQAQVGLSWTTIAPANQDTWNQLRAKTEQELSSNARGLTDRNLGNTNFVAAFESATELFRQRAPQQSGCPRRALFLLTDGQPFLGEKDDPKFSIPSHMDKVKTLVQGELTDLGVGVWVTGVNDSRDNYWTRMLPYWNKILPVDEPDRQPYAWRVNDEDEIGERFTKLMIELTERDISYPPIGPCEIGPYWQQIIFTLYKLDPATEHLDISDEVGPLTETRTDVQVKLFGYDEPIESLVVNRPLPGTWQINTTAPRADVIIDEIPVPAAGILIEPKEQNTVQYVQDQLAFQIVDSEGLPLPDYSDPLYQLTVSGTVSAGGQSWPVSFARGPNQTYTASFIPVSSEPYQLSVNAISRRPMNCDRAQMETFSVLSGVIGGFQAQPTHLVPLGAPVITSSTGWGCAPQVGDQATLRYQTQKVADKSPVVLSLPVTWEAQVSGPQQASPVTIEGPNVQGVYSLTFPLEESGIHRLAAVATLTDPEGKPHKLLDDPHAFEVNVVPIQPLQVELRLVEPADKPWWWKLLGALHLAPTARDRAIARDPMWRWLPLQVEAQITVPGNATPQNPTVVLTNTAAYSLPLELIVADATGSHPQSIPLLTTATPGRYRADIEGLKLGQVTLRAQFANGVLAACGYSLAHATEVQVTRMDNPWILIECAFAGLVLLLIVLSLLWRWCGRRNSVEGFITVLDAKGKRVDGWYQEIADRNHWRFGDVPARTGIATLAVRSTEKRCGRNPYQGGKVYVTLTPLQLPGGPPPVPSARILGPNEIWENASPGYAVKFASKEENLGN